jgi:hypothetical protein
MLRKPSILLLGAALLLAVGRSEGQDANLRTFKGKVLQVGSQGIHMNVEDDYNPLVLIDPKVTKLNIVGTAELTMLRRGLRIRLSAVVDEGGSVADMVDSIAIVSQAKDAEEGVEAVDKDTRQFKMTGRIASIKRNKISINLPVNEFKIRRVNFELQDKATINLAGYNDFTVAQNADSMEVKGTYNVMFFLKQGIRFKSTHYGQLVAKEITIELVQPAGLRKQRIAPLPIRAGGFRERIQNDVVR